MKLIASAALAAAVGLAHGQVMEHREGEVQRPLRINMNGNLIENPLADPILVDGRVMVPLRGVLEQMDASIEWLPEQKVVVAKRGDTTLTLGVGQNYGTVGSTAVPLDVPAMIMNGRTMVPLRYVAEALNAYVFWDAPNRTVVITTRLDQTA